MVVTSVTVTCGTTLTRLGHKRLEGGQKHCIKSCREHVEILAFGQQAVVAEFPMRPIAFVAGLSQPIAGFDRITNVLWAFAVQLRQRVTIRLRAVTAHQFVHLNQQW